MSTRKTADYCLIFINWRTPDLTLKAIQSARASVSENVRLRILIVDNGSGDESVERFHREAPDVECLALPANLGFAKAVNAGLKQAREPIVFILNSDLTFQPQALERLADALNQDSKAVLACPRLLRPDGSEQAAAVPEPRLFWELTNRSLPRRLMRLPAGQTAIVPSVVGPCMAVHRQRLETIGLLDERFFFFFEETDWCRRITRSGQHILLVPAAVVVHLQGESANQRPSRARIQFYASRYRYFHKHTGLPGVALLFTGLWLRLTLNLLVYTILTLLTFGKQKQRLKLRTTARLWLWHLLLCRPHWGFEP